MSEYSATVSWSRQQHEKYTDNQYSRAHEWSFDGGFTVAASASPQVVPLPFSVAANVDPEEAFVASLCSCHMLFFLSIAAKKNFVVDEYTDNAVGLMAKGKNGKLMMTQVTLRPKTRFYGDRQPGFEQLQKMHHQAHEQCFIANSVITEVITDLMPS